jgi:hypothetical protein
MPSKQNGDRNMSTATKAPAHKYIGDLHHEHMMWLNTLQFRKEETAILERRMEEIVRRNNQPDVMAELEHFQNQFIRQHEVIDELRHDVKAHENELEKEAMDHPVAIDHRHFADHDGLRDRMEIFEKIYMELKNEFYRWASKWM